jgi:hypothetical protein
VALPNLATDQDLIVRGVVPSPLTDTMLAVASATIRNAAGRVPISQTTSTVRVLGWGEQLLLLPGAPVVSVASVTVDGDPVSADDYVLDTRGLWCQTGWGSRNNPAVVIVTMTHGLTVVPSDIVQLTVDLAIAGATAAGEGAHDPRVVAETIDDYTVRWATGADAVASSVDLPLATRRALAGRFGGGAAIVAAR